MLPKTIASCTNCSLSLPADCNGPGPVLQIVFLVLGCWAVGITTAMKVGRASWPPCSDLQTSCHLLACW